MKTLIAMCTLFAGLTVMPAYAATVSYFGEDLNPTTGKPAGNIPNSLSARDNFVSSLTQAYLFDVESGLGSSPTLETFSGTNGTLGTRQARFAGDAAGSEFLGVDFSTSGTQILGGTEGWSLYNFSEPTNAFGLFGILQPQLYGEPTELIAQTPIRLNIKFTNGDIENFAAPNTLDLQTPSIAFFGIADNSRFIERVLIHGTKTPNLDLLFDDVYIGQSAENQIPTPASVLLILPGLFFIGRARGVSNAVSHKVVL